MTNTRIVMVDDHGLFRDSLGRLLDGVPEFRILARCANSAEALHALATTPADVVLLDYDLGDETGFALLTEIKRRWSDMRVLMVTAGLSDEGTLHIMEAGASGVFLKHGSPDRLVAAIRRVADGEVWLDDSSFHSMLAGRRNRTETAGRAQPLTTRQSEVLRGVLDGLANKEVAWKLNVSESSIKAVIQELFQKAGVRTRSQLVRIAIEKHSSDWLKSGNRG